jgi:hypothetical protein
MRTSKELTNLFFRDLKTYNSTNFKTIANADLSKQDATVHKAFSSVVTRYFIFREKHPEVSEVEHQVLYFKLKLDLIAAYFSEYPDTTTDNLVAFQLELKRYIKETRRNGNEGDVKDDDTSEQKSSLPDIQLESDNTVQVEQQQGSVSFAS